MENFTSLVCALLISSVILDDWTRWHPRIFLMASESIHLLGNNFLLSLEIKVLRMIILPKVRTLPSVFFYNLWLVPENSYRTVLLPDTCNNRGITLALFCQTNDRKHYLLLICCLGFIYLFILRDVEILTWLPTLLPCFRICSAKSILKKRN